MIFRLSQKLNAKIEAGKLIARPMNDNPFADWSAHLFIVDRIQYILLTNTKSLYSTLMYGKGISTERRFIDQALSGIRECMEADGQSSLYERFIAPMTVMVDFGTSLNRSVTGSMNDFVVHASIWLTEGGLSPFDTGFKLNQIPCSPLQYRRPRDVFTAMSDPSGE